MTKLVLIVRVRYHSMVAVRDQILQHFLAAPIATQCQIHASILHMAAVTTQILSNMIHRGPTADPSLVF